MRSIESHCKWEMRRSSRGQWKLHWEMGNEIGRVAKMRSIESRPVEIALKWEMGNDQGSEMPTKSIRGLKCWQNRSGV